MTKRKCGTCRFFEDRELAGSGWCTNPARRELHNMVMVRKTELACRNSWDQDLWQARTADQTTQPSNAEDDARAAQLHDIPPPTVDDASGAEAARNGYTDKIQSIGVPLSAARAARPELTAMDANSDIEEPFESVRDPRTAVRDAQRRRQQQLDALRGHDRAPSLRLPPVTPPPVVVAPPDEPAEPQAADAVPVARAPRIERARRDIPIPLPLVEGLPSARDAGAQEPASRHTARQDDPTLAPATPELAGPAASRMPHTAPLPTQEVQAWLRASHDAEPVLPAATAPEPAPQVRQTPEPPRVEQRLSDTHDRRRAPVESPNSRSGAPRSPDVHDQQRGPAEPPARRGGTPRLPDAHIDAWPGLEPGRYAAAPVVPPRQEPPLALAADPIDSADRLRAVQRCCGTCRSFRRNGDGEQGWCENAHAFPERRMVKSSGLACRSSIGVWWLPHDDLWLERADITHHGRPTPLMDDLGRAMLLSKQVMESREADA